MRTSKTNRSKYVKVLHAVLLTGYIEITFKLDTGEM